MKMTRSRAAKRFLGLILSASLMLGGIEVPVFAEPARQRVVNTASNNGNASLPSKWDYDNIKDYMPDLKDQGDFNSCWAVSVTSLAEINLKKKGLRKRPNLSEMQLAYFTYNNVTDPLGGTAGDVNKNISGKSNLNAGGNLDQAANVIATWIGLAEEEGPLAYPASSGAEPASLDSKYAYSKDLAHLQDFRVVNPDPTSAEDMNTAKSYIKEWGGFALSLFVPANSIPTNIYNKAKNAYYDPTNHGTTNHSVVVVGWDDDFPASNFAQDPGHNGAWLIRNSGATGAYKDNLSFAGYFWLSYYSQNLGSARAFDYELCNNYHNNYQYDGGFSSETIDIYYNQVTGANVFKANASEKGEILKAVAFRTDSPDEDFTVSVFVSDTAIDGDELENLVKKTPAATETGHVSSRGYYTIPLKTSVNLKSGQYFAVVLELKNESYANAHTSIGFECENSQAGWYSTTPKVKANQSFLFDGDYWNDVSELKNDYPAYYGDFGNFRIKAFTDNVGQDHYLEPEVEPEPEPLISIADASVTGVTDKTYTGKALSQNPTVKVKGVTLKNGTDYTLSYSENIRAGKATMIIFGKGKYTGTKKVTFKILSQAQAKKMTNAVVTGLVNKKYNGKTQKQNLTVTLGGKTLRLSKDYTISYSNNKRAGTATVYIRAKGKTYTGTKKLTFKISKADNPIAMAGKTAPPIKASNLEKSARSLSVTKVIKKVNKGKGTLKYTKKSGSSKIKINSSTGKVTVAKKTPAGTYKVEVNVTAKGTHDYAKKTVPVTFYIRVT